MQNESSEAVTWHRRLDYMSQRGLQELCKQELIKVKDLHNLDFVRTVFLEKHTD